MAVPRRPSLPDPSGASDREGTALLNRHGWTSGAGMVWLFPAPRVERARARPASDEFWRYGVLARQGPSRRRWRLAQRRQRRSRGRGRLLSARHTLPARTISRMRARATHRRLQHAMGAAAARESSRERRCVRRAGDGAGGGSSDGAGGGSSEAGRQHPAMGADLRLAADVASVS